MRCKTLGKFRQIGQGFSFLSEKSGSRVYALCLTFRLLPIFVSFNEVRQLLYNNVLNLE